MPRVLIMTSDLQPAACAPLDLRTNSRERGRAAPGTPERQTLAVDAPPACTDTRGPASSRACTLSTDKSSLKLPFRKRPIVIEAETERHAAERGSRLSPTESAESPGRSAKESPVWVSPMTLSQDGQPLFLRHQFNYGSYQMLCVPPMLEPSQHLLHRPENFYQASLSLATRQDEDGDTALHIAVVQGEFAIVHGLIQLFVLGRRSLDIYNNLRQTPLHLAVITKQTDIVEALLRAGADPSALDRNGQTALHLCSVYEQQQCMAVVLSLSSSTCLEMRNFEGLTPLHVAVLQGHMDLARLLLKTGADINAMDIKSGQTPLMHAVESNNAEMVHFLIESGCDVNSRSCSGNTALHGACGRGQVDTVRLLLKNGADSSIKNYHNDTPVMVARNKKITDVLRGRSPKQTRVHDRCLSASPHGGFFLENGSPSPSPSRECSPSSLPHSAFYSPKTHSVLSFPFTSYQSCENFDYLHPPQHQENNCPMSERRK